MGRLEEAALDAAMDTDPDETMALVADLTAATDPELRAAARRVAARLFLDVARRGRTTRRAVGRLQTQRYRPDGGDLDLDASLDALVGTVPEVHGVDVDELRVSGWVRPELALCLVVDRSGSMGGAPLATAAVAAAAAAQRAPGDHSVLAFSNEVLVITTQLGSRPSADVVDTLLSLRGHGTTDIDAALRAAAEQLAASRATRRVTVLLSDCRSNGDRDPLDAARALDDLVVIAPASDAGEAQAFAAAVGARIATIDGPSAIPAAFDSLLA